MAPVLRAVDIDFLRLYILFLQTLKIINYYS